MAAGLLYGGKEEISVDNEESVKETGSGITWTVSKIATAASGIAASDQRHAREVFAEGAIGDLRRGRVLRRKK